MPDSLKFEADKRFFEQGLDDADVVIHGRHSDEKQPHSPGRKRLILTRTVAALAPDPSNPLALRWNPAGAGLEQALDGLGLSNPVVGVIGGTEVFGMFLDRYDVFYLTRAPDVWLPGGRPVFPDVPARTPEAVLAEHGLEAGERRVLDQAAGLAVVSWRRQSGLRKSAKRFSARNPL